MTTSDPYPPDRRCPCTSGEVYGACCGPVIASGRAPGAVRLMRSRFTAFALGDVDHLWASWHPRTRPAGLELDQGLRWQRLEILDQVRGGPFDDDGLVEFEAFYRDADGRGSLRERSRFVREGGIWFYVDGVVGTD